MSEPFHAWLTRRIEESGLSKPAVAELIGVSHSHVRAMAKGARWPSRQTAQNLVRVLDSAPSADALRAVGIETPLLPPEHSASGLSHKDLDVPVKQDHAVRDDRFYPFGLADVESELEAPLTDYAKLFYEQTPFNDISLHPDRYIFRGRRGSGKSALAEHFRFQSRIPNAQTAHFGGNTLTYQLTHIGQPCVKDPTGELETVVKSWKYVMWCLVFASLRQVPAFPTDVLHEITGPGLDQGFDHWLNRVLDHLALGREHGVFQHGYADEMMSRPAFARCVDSMLAIVEKEPLIVAVDTAEHYDIHNQATMYGLAGLVQAGSEFNRVYSHKGLHFKLFVPDESFPRLLSDFMSNPGKHVRQVVSLHWRPKDLLCLVCWRYHCLLKRMDVTPHDDGDIDWTDFKSVRENMWYSYFARSVVSRCGNKEASFPYVIRHTQLRPRQAIQICNEIATIAKELGTFPKFPPEAIVDGVQRAEINLATEVINSYSQVYKGVSRIVGALSSGPALMPAKDLHKIAPRTAPHWESGEYSKEALVSLAARLGIIGRVRSKNNDGKWLAADFQYSMTDDLWITDGCEIVFHPMFCTKLNRSMEYHGHVAYPFPAGPEYDWVTEE